MSKHTPGPWLVEDRTVYALTPDGWRKGVEQFRNRFTASVQRDRECPDEEAQANARLIAAAPDLLEALIEMEREKSDYMARNNLGDPSRETTNLMARAAITKATQG